MGVSVRVCVCVHAVSVRVRVYISVFYEVANCVTCVCVNMSTWHLLVSMLRRVGSVEYVVCERIGG